MKDFDVIIIGGGMGGLVSAGILTAKGLKTLMIEKNENCGGYLASFKRRGFIFDSAVDCISGVTFGGLILKVLELLNVHKDISFVRLEPIRVSKFPDHHIAVDADIYSYINRITSLFPSESEGIKRFFKTATQLYEIAQSINNMLISGELRMDNISSEALQCMKTSYKDLLDEYLHDHRLKAILSDRCPFIGLSPSGISAFSMIVMMMSYFMSGACRPVGGFQRLADVMVDGIKKNGGSVINGDGVNKILIDGKEKCYGARCDTGEEFTSRYIISNADYNFTFKNLLSEKYASIAEENNKILGISTSFFIVYAGIRGGVRGHSSIGYFPSYDMDSYFTSDIAFKDASTIGVTVASLEDNSRVPPDCHTVVIHEMVKESRRKIDKAKSTDILIKKVDKIIPQIQDRIVVLDAATPLTLQRYTGNFNGAAFGWRNVPKIKNITKHRIPNLYIAGHWGDMGGGVLAAAYSGAQAAVDILKKEGLSIDI